MLGVRCQLFYVLASAASFPIAEIDCFDCGCKLNAHSERGWAFAVSPFAFTEFLAAIEKSSFRTTAINEFIVVIVSLPLDGDQHHVHRDEVDLLGRGLGHGRLG